MARGAAKSRPAEAPAEQAARGGFFEQTGTLLLAVAIALAIRAFVIEPFRIPSGSMLPTLLIGDHLFVNKFLYGPRIPFTGIRLPGIREPERGDIIVFTVAREGARIHPADRRPDLPHEEFVKRIVGLPGDVVEVRPEGLYVNGEKVVAEPTGESFTDEAGRELRVLRERLDGAAHRILDDPQRMGILRSPVRVEPGRYFVMGDNRDHSNDSRVWGTVALSDIKGPAFIIYWSWNYNGGWAALLNPVTWFRLLTRETRWERIGHLLE